MNNNQEQLVYLQNYDSPCGEMVLASTDGKLCLCDWSSMPCANRNRLRIKRRLNAKFIQEPSAVITRTKTQLDEFFTGKRTTFSIPLYPIGTYFQERVWATLQEIPYGETCTYKEIAARIGYKNGIRAVAQAIGANGISIIIPCHRVIGSNNSLTGFAGGLEAKRILLELEKSNT